MLSIEPDDIVAMLSIDPDTIVSADAANRQLGQRPPGASAASGFPQRGQVAMAVIVFRCVLARPCLASGILLEAIRRTGCERLRAQRPFEVFELFVDLTWV
jgi:hypothetical protein